MEKSQFPPRVVLFHKYLGNTGEEVTSALNLIDLAGSERLQTWVYIYVYIYVSLHIDGHTHVRIHILIHIHIHIHIYVCTYIHIYNIYINIYIYIFDSQDSQQLKIHCKKNRGGFFYIISDTSFLYVFFVFPRCFLILKRQSHVLHIAITFFSWCVWCYVFFPPCRNLEEAATRPEYGYHMFVSCMICPREIQLYPPCQVSLGSAARPGPFCP